MNDRTDDLEALADRLEASGDYRVLRRLRRAPRIDRADLPEGAREAVVLDLETTGLEPTVDVPIEVGLVRFAYDPQGKILGVTDELSALEDPGRPLDPGGGAPHGHHRRRPRRAALPGRARGRAARRRGAGDRPQRRLRPPLRRAPLAGARGLPVGVQPARRPLARRARASTPAAWGRCSSRTASSSRAIARWRTATPCWTCSAAPFRATASSRSTGSGAPRARPPCVCGRSSSPFEAKDLLKARGYRWNGAAKAWWTDVPEEALEAERAVLATDVYPRGLPALPTLRVDARVRYSARVPESPPR